MRLVAKDKNTETVYYTYTFEDGSQALMYDNKYYTHQVWCGLRDLRRHLKHLANVRFGANWDSMIPDDWEVIDKEFFTNLGIY